MDGEDGEVEDDVSAEVGENVGGSYAQAVAVADGSYARRRRPCLFWFSTLEVIFVFE